MPFSPSAPPVRVCYVNPAGGELLDGDASPRRSFGGAEIALLQEARLLARDPAFDVHMLVHGDAAKQFRRDGITIHQIAGSYHDQPLPGFFAYRRAYWRALREVNAAIYIQRGVPADLYFLAAAFCRRYGRSYVQVLALAPTVPSATGGLRGLIRWFVLEQMSLHLATAVVALARDQLATVPPAVRRKTRVIYEGKIAPARLVGLTDRHFVLWAGRYAPEKRPEVFLQLARSFPDQAFVMAVVGTVDVPVPSNVTVLGNVPHPAMGELYGRARLVVHTSRSEGFSNVFIEAWSHGTPVISFGIDSDGAILRDRLGRHPATEAELARDVALLLSDADEWNTCSRNALARSRIHHDAERQLQRYKGLFEDLVPRRRRSSSRSERDLPRAPRILLVSATRGSGSGAERILVELLRGWPLGAETLAVLAPQKSQVFQVARQLGLPAVAFDKPDTLLGNWCGMQAALADLPPCDLIHGWTAQTFELVAALALRKGVPHTVTLHDHPDAPFFNVARRLLMRVGTARAAGIVCVSDALRDVCAQAGFFAPLVVIRNGLSHQDTARSPSGLVRVGFLGMAFGHKGEAVVKNWATHLADRPVRWHLFGGGPRATDHAGASRPAERITEHGHQPAQQIFDNLDVVVHPSLTFDPFPTVLLEAARAGLPVVASDVGGTREIVEHGDTGFLFDVAQPSEGLAYLERLIDDAPLRRAMGQTARAHFEGCFTIDKMVAAYRAFWTERVQST